jgi:hypothetical protein
VKKQNPFQAAILLHPHKGIREPLSSLRRAAPFDFSSKNFKSIKIDQLTYSKK